MESHLLKHFFNPLPQSLPPLSKSYIGGYIEAYYGLFPEWEKSEVILLGCSISDEYPFPADAIRAQLYSLSLPYGALKLSDLGNMITYPDKRQNIEILGRVLEILYRAKKTVIILGDSRELAEAQTLANHYFQEDAILTELDYCYISPYLDLQEQAYPDVNFRILSHFPPRIGSLTAIGSQKYCITEPEWKLMSDLGFPVLRYGHITGKMEMVEPYLREVHTVCLDMSAVCHAENPAGNRPSPAGFSTLEICQIAKYIGSGTQIASFSVTDYNPQKDIHEQGAKVAAMTVWYFLEGYYCKRPESIAATPQLFRTFKVKIQAAIQEIVFYQSTITERWWMQVVNEPRQTIVPCTFKDYQSCLDNEIPERWWQIFTRLS